MLNGWTLLSLSIAYVAVLFAIARWGDRAALSNLSGTVRALTYSLALAVYCTSWTFFGAVGSAATSGWLYLPIYLGPMLVFLFGWRLIQHIIAVSKRQNLTSIADFIAARYGKARSLAVAVTIIATIGSVPYIALQLKAIVSGFDTVAGYGDGATAGIDTALVTAAALAGFAVLFGTRKIDVTEHHDGMMLAIAFESLVKLLAFVAVGVFALSMLAGSEAGSVPAFTDVFSLDSLPDTFVTSLLLASAAILCLPRQFHVMVVEAREDANLDSARWLFPLYLLIFSLVVIPITLAGLALPMAGNVSADQFVLALPMAAGQEWLTALAFLGGFSAATGMAIVACVALSTMISNEIVLPLMLRRQDTSAATRRDYSALVLRIRRIAIAGIAGLAYTYYLAAGESTALASIGLLSFAAAAQFAPLLLFGMFWPRATRRGALAGLLTGFSLWLYTLFVPALARAGALPQTLLDGGLFGIGMLRPEALFVDLGTHPLTHGVAWSLGMNVLVLIGVSLASRQSIVERIQAQAFKRTPRPGMTTAAGDIAGDIRTADLLALAERFLGRQHAKTSFADFAARESIDMTPSAMADRRLFQFTERLLAGAIGASSARIVMTSALQRTGMGIGNVVALLDETSEAIRFNRKLLEAALENITQGVSVIDAGQRLIGWNRRYASLMKYPPGMLFVGQPIEELLRFNAQRGRFGSEDVEGQIQKRLEHLRSGTPHVYQSHFGNGTVIEIRGEPMPDGGYVSTFSDVTEFKAQEAALVESKLLLEQRVADRTAELEDAMRALSEAKSEAEDANASKTRFLAAAAHDLLQPLNATRLFTSLLHENRNQLPFDAQQLVDRVQSGLTAVEDLLSALLDISRLDTAAPEPDVRPVSVQELFATLRTQFADAFEKDGLELRVRRSALWVASDQALLRRILQNYLSNARRYTMSGGVILGLRRRGTAVALQVVDTGSGIAHEDQGRIFEEFQRLEGSDKSAKRGLGLGLAIVQRIAALLDHPIGMRSVHGKGSVFEVVVPLAAAPVERPAAEAARSIRSSLVGEPILCIDNESDILDGMAGLLTRWGALPETARTEAEALEVCDRLLSTRQRRPSLLLVDYHLDDGLTGLELIDSLYERLGTTVPALVLTADHTEAVAAHVRSRGHAILNKPVRPASLRAQMSALLGRRDVA